MTRLKLFKKWLKEQGVDLRDFEGFDLDKHGCAMLICPIDVPRNEDSNGICNNCPYNEFWIKEIEERKEEGRRKMSDFKIVSKKAEVDQCYGLDAFYITKEEIAALLSGKKLYSTVNCDEYAITIEMDGEDELPSVTPQEPRKGHWIHHDEERWVCSEHWECSYCHKTTMTNPMYPYNDYDHMYYCPKCGADMRECFEQLPSTEEEAFVKYLQRKENR